MNIIMMKTYRAAVLSFICALALAPCARAAPDAEARLGLERLLSAYEPSAAALKAALSALGSEGTDALIAISRDANLSPLKRLRAIELLGAVPTPAGLSYLRQLALARRDASEPLPIYELAASLSALSGFGVEAQGDIVPFLSHGSADVREAAVSSLARIGSETSLRLLRGRLLIERDAAVRGLIRRSLALPARSR